MGRTYFGRQEGLGDPANSAVIPSMDDEIQTCRAVYIGTGGDLVVQLDDDPLPVKFVNVPDGSFLPLRVRKFVSAGTTTTDLLALY